MVSEFLMEDPSLVDIFQRDTATVKRWIRCASSAPAGFPRSEWDALVKGDTVEIDTVFSSLHHIHSIDESVGRVGTTEIQFGRPKPAAKVETSGQWTAAYNLVVKATLFLFPHRYDELRQYGDYIEELFSAKSTSIHPKLFKYDEAVRYKVRQGQNILLTDRSQFTRYYEAIVAPDGVGAEGEEGGSKAGVKKGGKSGEKSDICHRFKERRDAVSPLTNANTNTFARNASLVDMERSSAKSRRQCEELGRRPQYLRHNVFRNDKMMSRSSTEWTEVARPLASVPVAEFSNVLARRTIDNHPDLFVVNTPINIDNLENLLIRHPNRPFVESVLNGLRNGFWPWADTRIGEYPDTLDESLGDPRDEKELKFICEQRDKEIETGRFSRSFGRDLLPGMYSMPIHVVPKPHSNDLRLVTNHSAGIYSLNSMINREDITGYPLDNMTHLGEMLLKKKAEFPNENLVLFKSDISDAYRNLPMHPLWQVKQINTILGERHVDRRNCFRGKGSGSIFIGFNSLVTWIGKNEYEILDLGAYSDDSFRVEFAKNLAFYDQYNRYMPSNQVQLLNLWDLLGIPHKEKKQIHGACLTIIGIEVDANNLTLTLPTESKTDLVTHLYEFARAPEKSGVKYTLRDFQRLTGWFNWGLNVYPLLKPALSNVYAKMSHLKPDKPLTKLYVNNAIRSDLLWAVNHISLLPGTRVLQSVDWDLDFTDLTAYCDASLDGLGFWFPGLSAGYWSPIPENPPSDTIFYFEALSVLSAILHSTSFGFPIKKLVIYTDNMNTVHMFNSLSALPAYNNILKLAVDHLLSDYKNPIQLRVIHIPGDENTIADALSRGNLHTVVDNIPNITIDNFSPPRIRTAVL
jgi:hypothetical protein